MKSRLHSGFLALALFNTFLASIGTATSASAQTVDRQARLWAASCAGCHGTDGASKGGIPPIAGRDADALYRALIEFKTGQRPAATVMHQHAKGYTDEELKRIAQFFATNAAAK